MLTQEKKNILVHLVLQFSLTTLSLFEELTGNALRYDCSEHCNTMRMQSIVFTIQVKRV